MHKIVTAGPLAPPDSAQRSLSLLLAYMRALYLLHHTVHLTVRGPSFDGDHELAGNLYKQLVEEIDQLAEKLVSYYDKPAVSLHFQVVTIADHSRSWATALALSSPDNPNDGMLRVALAAEERLIEMATGVMAEIKASGTVPMELDDWLMGLCNAHGPYVYKLKARLRR